MYFPFSVFTEGTGNWVRFWQRPKFPKPPISHNSNRCLANRKVFFRKETPAAGERLLYLEVTNNVTYRMSEPVILNTLEINRRQVYSDRPCVLRPLWKCEFKELHKCSVIVVHRPAPPMQQRPELCEVSYVTKRKIVPNPVDCFQLVNRHSEEHWNRYIISGISEHK
jgi:hypothetical protein